MASLIVFRYKITSSIDNSFLNLDSNRNDNNNDNNYKSKTNYNCNSNKENYVGNNNLCVNNNIINNNNNPRVALLNPNSQEIVYLTIAIESLLIHPLMIKETFKSLLTIEMDLHKFRNYSLTNRQTATFVLSFIAGWLASSTFPPWHVTRSKFNF
jgi:hypothetical protein